MYKVYDSIEIRQATQLIECMAKHSPKGTQMDEHMKRQFLSLGIGEMPTKITIKYLLRLPHPPTHKITH